MRDSSFTGNASTGGASGGAIQASFTYRTDLAGPLTISGSTFVNNSTSITQPNYHYGVPEGGGAVAVFNHPLTITRSSFTGNIATTPAGASEGGAVLIWGDSTGPLPAQPATISTSTFTDNHAGVSTGFAYGLGGAIESSGVSWTLMDSLFYRNSAGQGGAVFNGGTLRMIRNVLVGNDTIPSGLLPPLAGGLFSGGDTTLAHDLFALNTSVSCALSGTLHLQAGVLNPDRTCTTVATAS